MTNLQISSHSRWYIAIASCQLLLVILVFRPFLWGEEQTAFAQDGDGLKNYFTFAEYLTGDTYLTFEDMQHPFGDYLLYMDNTPALAVFSKGLRDLGIPLQPIRWLHWICALSLVVSSSFGFAIGRRLISQPWLAASIATLLPWLSPQLLRLPLGHYNLSFSWVILGAIYGLIRYAEASKCLDEPFPWKWVTFLIGWMAFTGFLHLYYLPILGLLVSWWFVGSAFFEAPSWKAKLKELGIGLAIPMIAGGVILSLWRMIDGYFALRQAGAQGYNWSGWNLNPDALYTAYEFTWLPFPLQTDQWINTESFSYLGNLVLWGGMSLLVISLILPNRKLRWRGLFAGASGLIARLMLVAGVGCFLAGLGEYAQLFQGTVKLHNPLTPFFYLSLITEKATHFRAVARFVWPFVLLNPFLVGYLMSKFLAGNSAIWKTGLVSLLVILGSIDAANMMVQLRQKAVPNPFARAQLQASVAPLFEGINAEAYQAILPLPYFHVGTENYDLTIDPQPDWMRLSMQAAVETGLPLMSSVASRTPISHTEALFEMVQRQEVGDSLSKHLTEQPILLLVSQDDLHWRMPPDAQYEPARSVFSAGKKWSQLPHLELLAQHDKVSLYRWDWSADH
ncbi:MAG: hypothetical protein AAF399_17020 [Bacteroidota bacterium]